MRRRAKRSRNLAKITNFSEKTSNSTKNIPPAFAKPLLCAVFSFRGLNSTRWIQSEKWKSSTTLVFTHESAKIFGNLFRKFEFIHVDFIHGVKRKVCKSQIRNLTFGGKLFSQILVKVSVIFSAQKSKFSWVEVNQNFVKIPESCIQHCARNIAHNGWVFLLAGIIIISFCKYNKKNNSRKSLWCKLQPR